MKGEMGEERQKETEEYINQNKKQRLTEKFWGGGFKTYPGEVLSVHEIFHGSSAGE